VEVVHTHFEKWPRWNGNIEMKYNGFETSDPRIEKISRQGAKARRYLDENILGELCAFARGNLGASELLPIQLREFEWVNL